MRKTAIGLLLVILSVSAVSARVEVGDTILPFGLRDLNGTLHTPGKYKGKILGIMLLGHA